MYASRYLRQLAQPLYPFTPSSPSITPSRSRQVCPIPPIKNRPTEVGLLLFAWVGVSQSKALLPLLHIRCTKCLGGHRSADKTGQQEHGQDVGQCLDGLHRNGETTDADPLQADGDRI